MTTEQIIDRLGRMSRIVAIEQKFNKSMACPKANPQSHADYAAKVKEGELDIECLNTAIRAVEAAESQLA